MRDGNPNPFGVLNMLATYEIEILFIGGTLEGMTYTMILPRCSSTPFKVGQKVMKPCGGGSPYKVLSLVRI
jgi:hypothetical protein